MTYYDNTWWHSFRRVNMHQKLWVFSVTITFKKTISIYELGLYFHISTLPVCLKLNFAVPLNVLSQFGTLVRAIFLCSGALSSSDSCLFLAWDKVYFSSTLSQLVEKDDKVSTMSILLMLELVISITLGWSKFKYLLALFNAVLTGLVECLQLNSSFCNV